MDASGGRHDSGSVGGGCKPGQYCPVSHAVQLFATNFPGSTGSRKRLSGGDAIGPSLPSAGSVVSGDVSEAGRSMQAARPVASSRASRAKSSGRVCFAIETSLAASSNLAAWLDVGAAVFVLHAVAGNPYLDRVSALVVQAFERVVADGPQPSHWGRCSGRNAGCENEAQDEGQEDAPHHVHRGFEGAFSL